MKKLKFKFKQVKGQSENKNISSINLIFKNKISVNKNNMN